MSVIDDYQSGRAAAIPEEWNGIRYRSRLEAEVAQFVHWHFQGSTVDYEPESFRLEDGSSFCPDFRVTTKGGQHRLYVEARGHEVGCQLDHFANYCWDSEPRALFLVFLSDEVRLYAGCTWREMTNEPFFCRCVYCNRRTVLGVSWNDMEPDTDDALSINLVDGIEGVDELVYTGFDSTYPCHHCGAHGHTNVLGPPSFQVEMKQGKIHLETRGALLIKLHSSLDGRGWCSGADQ